MTMFLKNVICNSLLLDLLMTNLKIDGFNIIQIVLTRFEVQTKKRRTDCELKKFYVSVRNNDRPLNTFGRSISVCKFY